jgi:ribosomal protein S6E (S10)
MFIANTNEVVMATTYQQIGADIDGEAGGDQFGRSVSMSGDGTTFVVGAPFNIGVNGSNTGHVRVYKFNSTINTYT